MHGEARLAGTAKRHLQDLPCEARPRQPAPWLASREAAAALRRHRLDGAGISLRAVCQSWPNRRGVPYGIRDRGSHRSGQHHAARAEPVRGHLGRVGGARALCAHLLAIPPGGRAKAIATPDMKPPSTSWRDGRCCGSVRSWGRGSRWVRGISSTSRPRFRTSSPRSKTELGRGVVARIDPNKQESVELLPERRPGHRPDARRDPRPPRRPWRAGDLGARQLRA